jgi:hypothetical protein
MGNIEGRNVINWNERVGRGWERRRKEGIGWGWVSALKRQCVLA